MWRLVKLTMTSLLMSSMICTLRLVPTLFVNTPDLESLKFEARVHLNYFEACEVCLIG